MCLIVFAYNIHEKYKLILSANRDEFFNRPTEALGEWEDRKEIIGGRDLQAGGTWMAFNKNGRFAALTNVRDPASMRRDARSRGEIIPSFLLSDEPTSIYLETVKKKLADYNRFNLLAGNPEELFFLSTTDEKIIRIEPGIHAISNRTLNTPWVKVEKVKIGMERLCQTLSENTGFSDIETALLDFMKDGVIAPDEALPDTGVGIDLERKLSSVFVSMPGYGTRSTSVVLQDYSGNITFSEITWSENGERQDYWKIVFSI